MKRVQLRCPVCKREVRAYHVVQLDELNTVFHHLCRNEGNSLLPIKDQGVFKELKKKYAF